MIVVADGTPLHVLIEIGEVEILQRVFKTVTIPTAVKEELTHPLTPAEVRVFIEAPPSWLTIRKPHRIERISQIHKGEQAAISLARELNADILLMDDMEGRQAAMRRGIHVTGTIGIITWAAKAGLLDIKETFLRIQKTRFRHTPALLNDAYRYYLESRKDRDQSE